MSEIEDLQADMRDAAEAINEFMSYGEIAWEGKAGTAHYKTCNRIIDKYFVYPNPNKAETITTTLRPRIKRI